MHLARECDKREQRRRCLFERLQSVAWPLHCQIPDGTPKSLPFAGYRPYVKELRDGRVLLTYRNMSGTEVPMHWAGRPARRSWHVQCGGDARSPIAPNGDYLVMFAGGAGHYLFTYDSGTT